MLFRGHPLVWYASNPPWLEAAVAAARDETIFTDYIAAAAGRYRGHLHSWDVVNEAIEPKDGRADGLRDSFWLRKFGPSYIETAFAAAREADPSRCSSTTNTASRPTVPITICAAARR